MWTTPRPPSRTTCVPIHEIEALAHFWHHYAGLRESCFAPRTSTGLAPTYADWRPALAEQRAIAELVKTHPGVLQAQERFMAALQTWWQQHLPLITALAPDPHNRQARATNVYAVRSTLLASIERSFAGPDAPQTLLSRFQVRGAFANYWQQLAADFKSIAASGWGAELIPDQDILQSQFPQVLAELEQQHARLAELQALFAAASEEDFEDSDDTGVLPADEVKALKASLKDTKGQLKLAKRDPALGDAAQLQREVDRIEAQLARHKTLEDEAKALKVLIKSTTQNRDALVAQARAKIATDEARHVITERLGQVLLASYRHYLRADQRDCVAAIENLWRKYAVTARQIEAERDAAAVELQGFLRELGYA
jgi:type I restriction enzyme M protein